MTLTLLRVDSLRPIPPSRSIEAPQSDPSRVKEEDRQVEVLCREGISLTLGGSPPFEGTGSSLKDDGNRAPSTQSAAASSSELQSPPPATANSEAAENQPLTFFTTNAAALAVGPANFAGVDSVKGTGRANSSFFPPLPLRGGSNPSDGGAPLPAGNGGSFTTIVVPRETLVPYDPPQSPCTGRVQAGKKRKTRMQYTYTAEKGFHEIEVSESESDEESGVPKKKKKSPWAADDKDSSFTETFEEYLAKKGYSGGNPFDFSSAQKKASGGLFAATQKPFGGFQAKQPAKEPAQKVAPSKGRVAAFLQKKGETPKTVFEWTS